MQETLFILGREPELSVAELESRAKPWSGTVQVVSPQAALIRHAGALPDRVLNRLGGSIKHVRVLERWAIHGSLPETFIQCFTWDWLQPHVPSAGRVEFGASGYGLTAHERAALNRQGLIIKKAVKASGRPVRFVVSKEPQLSAVTVQRNGLLTNGRELVFVRQDEELIVGLTLAVQDYQLYGLRDYGRPAANAKSGMLPPKLAQVMLNMAGVKGDDVLLDPFCGSGTVLQEAALMGVGKIHGSDLEPRPVKDSQENIRWLMKEFPDITSDIEITMRDARQVSVMADVIVTEPYLGKPLRGHEPKDWLDLQARDLGRMYLQCFQHWQKHVKPGGRVVMIWPEFVVGGADVTINLGKAITGLGFTLQPLLTPTSAAAFHIPDPTVLTYGRDEAKVRRQIRMWVRK